MNKRSSFSKVCCTALCLLSTLGCSTNTNKDKVSNITLNDISLSIFEGDTYQLEATVTPENADNKDLIWESLDNSVATVNQSGLVTGVKDGLTEIKVTSLENNEISATCSVDVSAKLVEIEDKDIVFEKKKMDAYVFNIEEKSELEVFYRTDSLKQIPYVSLKTFYKTYFGFDLDIKTIEENTYLVSTKIGGEATFNTELETIESDDYQKFASTTQIRQEGITNVYLNSAPFLRINRVDYENPPEKTILNLKKYYINMVGKDEDIFLPLVSASNLFMGPSMITCIYNKNAVYFIDGYDPKFTSTDLINEYGYQTGVTDFFENGRRSYDEAQFAYGQICFLVDTYYGLPGREVLDEKLKQYHDLDKALETYSDASKAARSLLKSKDMIDYFAGLIILNDLLYDAGHSYASYGINAMFNNSLDLQRKVTARLGEIPYRSGEDRAKNTYDTSYQAALARKRFESGLRALSSTKKGDTVMFTFDSFVFNRYKWEEYYENPTLDNLPNDAVGNFKKMLEKYKDDPTVKNVVVDISNNGGGMADVVTAYMGLMTGKTYQYSYDSINKNYVTTYYEFDANFDGKFDEEDKNVTYDFNFAILCSNYSFSCGNMLPMQAKENGIMILGDKSGGGSCAVIIPGTAEGIYMRLSCPYHMTPLDKSDVEFGIQADVKLVSSSGPNSYNFNNFYNLSYISQEMAKFYA